MGAKREGERVPRNCVDTRDLAFWTCRASDEQGYGALFCMTNRFGKKREQGSTPASQRGLSVYSICHAAPCSFGSAAFFPAHHLLPFRFVAHSNRLSPW